MELITLAVIGIYPLFRLCDVGWDNLIKETMNFKIILLQAGKADNRRKMLFDFIFKESKITKNLEPRVELVKRSLTRFDSESKLVAGMDNIYFMRVFHQEV